MKLSIQTLWAEFAEFEHIILLLFSIRFYFTGDQKDTDVGPLITPAAKERCERLIQSGIDQGANVS